jgi:hypothetical protein
VRPHEMIGIRGSPSCTLWKRSNALFTHYIESLPEQRRDVSISHRLDDDLLKVSQGVHLASGDEE